ncbi:hypothetical protein K439DRAFT_1643492 [Ramaria rubella]|nr:hypothetical protein K439DRAFT_1643492 [Ramaria rubella]
MVVKESGGGMLCVAALVLRGVGVEGVLREDSLTELPILNWWKEVECRQKKSERVSILAPSLIGFNRWVQNLSVVP